MQDKREQQNHYDRCVHGNTGSLNVQETAGYADLCRLQRAQAEMYLYTGGCDSLPLGIGCRCMSHKLAGPGTTVPRAYW